jgi:signal transduction histidine kinase/DNA-binding NarL/FixJ family response regulator
MLGVGIGGFSLAAISDPASRPFKDFVVAPDKKTMKTTSKTVVLAGFSAMLILLISLLLIWVRSVTANTERIASIVRETREQELMFGMRDAAHKRALSLFRMAAMDDPFERDDEYIRFKEYAGNFITARDELLDEYLSENEQPIWERARPMVLRGSTVQNAAVELILDDRIRDAHRVLHDEVMPTQESVMEQLTQMLTQAQSHVREQLDAAVADNRATFIAVLALGGGALTIGLLIALFVIRRSGAAEHALVEQSERLQMLYATVSTAGLTLDEQINAMLRKGCEFLGLEIGKVSRIDLAEKTNTFMYTYCAPGLSVKSGVVVPLESSFCSITVASLVPIALAHVARSEYRNHACYEFSKLESYIAAPLHVSGNIYGTVNFAARAPRARPFSARDIELVQLIAGWIGVTVERVLAQQELSVAKDAAEGASRAKSVFVANMSHEIRTPLTAIVGYAESLSDPTLAGDDRAKAVKTVIRSSQHLAQIINDILDLSKIEAGQLQVERIDMSVADVFSEVESVMSMQARDKGLAFTVNYRYPLPERIVSDPVRFKQILLNLCSNAIKFTPSGRVDVNVSYDSYGRRLIARVCDTGIGMSPEEKRRLFKPFSQTDVSTTRRFGGTGLGLWISQQLAAKLGGGIECLSEKGVGSEFEASIDVGEPAPNLVNRLKASTESGAAAITVPALAGTILLAEDSPDIQDLISFYAHRTGVQLEIVDDGKKAVERALTRDYHLVLMDMQMPVMDGLSAMTLLRRSGYSGPIVSLTANALREDREKCLAAGAVDFLSKPIDVGLFYKTLQKFLPAREAVVARPGNPLADLNNDPDFQLLVQRFLSGLPAMLQEVLAAAEQKAWEPLRAVVHRLKGLGGGFGYPQISEAAAVLHEELRAGVHDNVDRHVAEIKRLVEAACSDAKHAA